MNGKIVKISSNDLYGNVDDRQVAIFAAFIHKKYMNNYAIFTFAGEYQKSKLYYGSVHIKGNSLVVFSVPDSAKQYIDKFISDYLKCYVDANEFEIINISNVEKIELVSYNDVNFNYLNYFDSISIPKAVNTETVAPKTKSKNAILYFLLIIMLGLLVGISFLYFFPENFVGEYKQLTCTKEEYNEDLKMKYNHTEISKYDDEDKVKEIEALDTYIFVDEDDYLDFKDNNREKEYFKEKGTYTYDDDEQTLRITYSSKSIIDGYEEMKEFLSSEGYTCQEGTYNE